MREISLLLAFSLNYFLILNYVPPDVGAENQTLILMNSKQYMLLTDELSPCPLLFSWCQGMLASSHELRNFPFCTFNFFSVDNFINSVCLNSVTISLSGFFCLLAFVVCMPSKE